MPEWIISFALNHDLLIYFLAIVFAFFQGPLLALIFGVLLSLGYLHIIPVYVSLMLGDLIGDTIWYHVGRKYGHSFVARWGTYFSLTEDRLAKVFHLFKRFNNTVLFVSKITNGFGFAIVTLMAAGMIRVPFGKYLFINLAGQFIWTGALIVIGYTFSNAYIYFDNWDGRVSLTIGLVCLAFLIYRYVSYLRAKAEAL